MRGYQKLKTENIWLWAFLQSYVDFYIEDKNPKTSDEERKKLVQEKLDYIKNEIKRQIKKNETK